MINQCFIIPLLPACYPGSVTQPICMYLPFEEWVRWARANCKLRFPYFRNKKNPDVFRWWVYFSLHVVDIFYYPGSRRQICVKKISAYQIANQGETKWWITIKLQPIDLIRNIFFAFLEIQVMTSNTFINLIYLFIKKIIFSFINAIFTFNN